MKKVKKSVSFVLALLMLLSMFSALPFTADADEKEYETISIGETKNVVTDSDETIYFKFVADKDTKIVFTSNSDVDTYGYLYDENFEELASNDDGGGKSDFKVSYRVKSGSTYYLGCKNYYGEESSFKISLSEFVNSEKEIKKNTYINAEADEYEPQIFKYTADKTEKLQFNIQDADISVKVLDSKKAEITDSVEYKYSCAKFNAEKNNVYYFECKSNDGDKEFTAFLTGLDVESINIGDTKNIEGVTNELTFIRFTADKNCRVAFNMVSDYNLDVGIYNERFIASDSYSGKDIKIKEKVEEGKTYYLGFKTTKNKNASVKIVSNEVLKGEKEIKLNDTLNVDIDEDESQLLKYSADVSESLKFIAFNSQMSLQLLDSEMNQISYPDVDYTVCGEDGFRALIFTPEKGKVYYIKCINYNERDIEVSVTLNKETPDPIDINLNENKNLNSNDFDVTQLFKYEAEKSCDVFFYCSSEFSLGITIYDSEKNDITNKSIQLDNRCYCVSAEAGKTYYFGCKMPYDYLINYSVSLTEKNTSEYTDLVTGKKQRLFFIDSNDKTTFRFTPDKDGLLRFKSDSGYCIYKAYDSSMNEIEIEKDEGWDKDFDLVLKSGETYYFEMKSRYSKTAFTVNFDYYAFSDLPVINPGETKTINAEDLKKDCYYKFTAESDGFANYYSKGLDDYFGNNVYDSEFKSITINSPTLDVYDETKEENTYYNFSDDFKVEKGKTYYLYFTVEDYSGSIEDDAEYTIGLNFYPRDSFESINSDTTKTINGEYGKLKVFKLTAPKKCTVECTVPNDNYIGYYILGSDYKYDSEKEIYSLEKDESLYLCCYSSKKENYSLSVKFISLDDIETIGNNETKKVQLTSTSQKKRFVFDSAEEGLLNIDLTTKEGTHLALYDTDYNRLDYNWSESDANLITKIAAGKYIIDIYSDEEGERAVSLSIIKTSDIQSISYDEEKNVSIDSKGEYKYYKFTPNQDKVYTIKSTGDSKTSCKIVTKYEENGQVSYSLDCKSDVSSDGHNFEINKMFKKNTEYLLAVSSEDDNAEFSIKIDKFDGYIEIKDGESKYVGGDYGEYLKYVATDNGIIRIETPKNSSRYCSVYDSEKNLMPNFSTEYYDQAQYSYESRVKAGQTYLIKGYTDGWDSDDYETKVSLKLNSDSAYETVVDGEGTIRLDNYSQRFLKFTPRKTGTVSFYITLSENEHDDYEFTPTVNLYDGTGKLLEGSSSKSSERVLVEDYYETYFYYDYRYSVTAGETYYVTPLKRMDINYINEKGEREPGEYPFTEVVGDLEYSFNRNKTASVTAYKGEAEDVVIPDTVNDYKVTSIAENAFSSNDKIKSVKINAALTSIGRCAFQNCTSLESIDLPNSIEEMGSDVFYNCFHLIELSVPDKLTNFDSLSTLSSLKRIELGRHFGDYDRQDEDCEAFKVLDNCNSLEYINVDEKNEKYTSVNGVLFNKDKTTLIKYPANQASEEYSIPETVESIYKYAFASVKSLKTLKYNEKITSFRSDPFMLEWYSESESSIENVYFGKSFIFDNDIYSIYRSFPALKSITLSKENENYYTDDGIIYNKDVTKLVYYPISRTDEEYVFPDTLTSIDGYAFGKRSNAEAKDLKKLVINTDFESEIPINKDTGIIICCHRGTKVFDYVIKNSFKFIDLDNPDAEFYLKITKDYDNYDLVLNYTPMESKGDGIYSKSIDSTELSMEKDKGYEVFVFVANNNSYDRFVSSLLYLCGNGELTVTYDSNEKTISYSGEATIDFGIDIEISSGDYSKFRDIEFTKADDGNYVGVAKNVQAGNCIIKVYPKHFIPNYDKNAREFLTVKKDGDIRFVINPETCEINAYGDDVNLIHISGLKQTSNYAIGDEGLCGKIDANTTPMKATDDNKVFYKDFKNVDAGTYNYQTINVQKLSEDYYDYSALSNFYKFNYVTVKEKGSTVRIITSLLGERIVTYTVVYKPGETVNDILDDVKCIEINDSFSYRRVYSMIKNEDGDFTADIDDVNSENYYQYRIFDNSGDKITGILKGSDSGSIKTVYSTSENKLSSGGNSFEPGYYVIGNSLLNLDESIKDSPEMKMHKVAGTSFYYKDCNIKYGCPAQLYFKIVKISKDGRTEFFPDNQTKASAYVEKIGSTVRIYFDTSSTGGDDNPYAVVYGPNQEVPELATEVPTEETTAALTEPETTKPVETTAPTTTEPVETTEAPTVEPTTAAPTETTTVEPTKATTVEPTEPSTTAEPVEPTTVEQVEPTTSPVITTKKANPIKVTVKAKTVKAKKLKKKAQKVKAITVKQAKGKVTYKLTKIPKSIKKLVKINSKGVITFKKWKKAEKGNYKIKVMITAKGNSKYKKKTITKTIKLRIK